MKDISLKLMINILKNYMNVHDLTFLPKIMKIEKVKKLVANLHDKTEYVIHLRNLKQALNHGLILKKILVSLHLINETIYRYKHRCKEKSKK